MSIFKAYDIRGIVPQQLNPEIAEKIGKSIAKFLNVKTIVVGRDMRTSGEEIFNALTKGIQNQGTDVIDIGIISTPVIYFAVNHLNADASIMITASHNPPNYNGFKLTRHKAIPISGDSGIKDIEKLFNENQFQDQTIGNVTKTDIKEDYKKHILKFSNEIKPLNVVIDTANGMGAYDINLLEKDLPINITKLFFKLDGTFPNHEADPLKEENIKHLKEEVKKTNADLGIAFDGDGDRVFFIDENSQRISADLITCLIAKSYLKTNPGAMILYDLRSSWIVKETIENLSGKHQKTKVGHAFIKEHMRKVDGLFAGELSGHFYYKESFYTDSGIITMLKILQILSKENKKISELIKPLKIYFPSGEINSKVENKEEILKTLESSYKEGKISIIDGLHVEFQDWWFNVRLSNTEPLLRLNLEAKTKELMEKKRDEILNIIRK